MNYHPLKNQETGLPDNMYVNLVGGETEQMGLFDYIFVLPFLAKFTMYKLIEVINSDNINFFFKIPAFLLLLVVSLVSVPLSLAKVGLYAALGLTGMVALGDFIKRKILSKRKSEYTKKLNKLMVKRNANPGEDEDTIRAQPLSEVNPINDGSVHSYRLRLHHNTIQLVRGLHNHVVAIIEKNDENIAILEELLPPANGNNNLSLMHWINNIATNNFINADVFRPVIEAYKHDKKVGIGASYIRDLHTILTYGPDTVKGQQRSANAENEVIGEPTVDFMKDMAKLDKNLRRIIADHVIRSQTNEPTAPIAGLTQDQRDEAYAKYLSRRVVQPLKNSDNLLAEGWESTSARL